MCCVRPTRIFCSDEWAADDAALTNRLQKTTRTRPGCFQTAGGPGRVFRMHEWSLDFISAFFAADPRACRTAGREITRVQYLLPETTFGHTEDQLVVHDRRRVSAANSVGDGLLVVSEISISSARRVILTRVMVNRPGSRLSFWVRLPWQTASGRRAVYRPGSRSGRCPPRRLFQPCRPFGVKGGVDPKSSQPT